ncbi:MAG: hypothetical protein ACOC1P_03670 [Minisyncoccales bacterium]
METISDYKLLASQIAPHSMHQDILRSMNEQADKKKFDFSLEGFTEEEREVFQLLYIQKNTINEVAEILRSKKKSKKSEEQKRWWREDLEKFLTFKLQPKLFYHHLPALLKKLGIELSIESKIEVVKIKIGRMFYDTINANEKIDNSLKPKILNVVNKILKNPVDFKEILSKIDVKDPNELLNDYTQGKKNTCCNKKYYR